jgi:rare lipoprotein A
MIFRLQILLFLILANGINDLNAEILFLQHDTTAKTYVQYGVASYYADKFIGKKTANGEIFSQKKMTAAHNTLPLGTYIEVTNLRNKKTIRVKVNDRLHKKNKRIVDLSKSAAQKLGFVSSGLTRVKIRVVE